MLSRALLSLALSYWSGCLASHKRNTERRCRRRPGQYWPPRRCLAFINLIISKVTLTFSVTPPSSTPLFPRFRKQLFPRPPSKSRMSFSLRFFHTCLDSWPKTPGIYLKIERTTPIFPPPSPHKFKRATLFGLDFGSFFTKNHLLVQGVFNKSKILCSSCVALVLFFAYRHAWRSHFSIFVTPPS